MWSNFSNTVKNDIIYIARNQLLLFAISAPFLLILFLRLIFPLISGYVLFKTGFQLENYYTHVAITTVSVIPMIFGMVSAFLHIYETDTHILQVIDGTPSDLKRFFCLRMIVPAILSFFMVLLTIVLTVPVPTEGWLRTIYVSLLLCVQSPLVFLFIGSFAKNRIQGLVLSKLYGIFLVAVPLGLLLHHPWNYFSFFSPLYWISWAWITSVPSESLIYGAITIILTSGFILIFLRHFLKKQTN
jgi:fluoroquinolone transport system permease protein